MGRKKLDKIQDQTYAFRIESAQKNRLEIQIERIRKALNKSNPDDRYKVTKNEIIIAALKRGLQEFDNEDLPHRRRKNV